MKPKHDHDASDATGTSYTKQFKRVASEHLRDYVESVTDAAPRFGSNAYICPSCKSGTGNNGKYTPAFFLFRTWKGDLHFKCHACGITGDIFDLAGLMNDVTSFAEKQRIVASFLGIDLDQRTPLDQIKVVDKLAVNPPTQMKANELKQEAAAYIRTCRKNAGKTDFFARRGLNQDIVERFNLGYDPERNWAVIPFSPTYYMARNTAFKPDVSGSGKHYKPKSLQQPPFNFPALAKRREPTFLTEAPLDALSIIQVGGNAMALGGTSTSVLRRIMAIYQPEAFFILAFDSDAAGIRATESMSRFLTGQGIPFTTPEHAAFTKYKDANAALMADPALLAEGVAHERERALGLWEQGHEGVGFTKVVDRIVRQRRQS